MIGAAALAVAAAGHRHGASAPSFELVDETGSTAFTAVPNLRVKIGAGAWQTLAAAGLTVSRTAPNKITVSGFADGSAAASAQWHYEQQIPGEPNSASGVRNALMVRRVGGPVPVNAGQPGHQVAATDAANPVVTA